MRGAHSGVARKEHSNDRHDDEIGSDSTLGHRVYDRRVAQRAFKQLRDRLRTMEPVLFPWVPNGLRPRRHFRPEPVGEQCCT